MKRNINIQDIFERIQKHSSVEDEFDLLVRELRALMSHSTISIGRVIGEDNILYRATSHHRSFPESISEIWAPPVEVANWGRANAFQKPVFYVSSDPNGAFRELDVRVGNYCVLAQWKVKKQFYVHEIGYAKRVFERLGAKRSPMEYDLYQTQILEDSVNRFIHDEFTRENPENYRLTAAIASMLMASDEIAGIKYPSIAKGGSVDNLAITPNFAATCLELVRADLVLIDKVEGVNDGEISGLRVAQLKKVKNDILEWEMAGNNLTTIPSEAAALLHIKHGEKKYLDGSGKIIINDLEYIIAPGYWVELIEDEMVIFNLLGQKVHPLGLQ